ASPSDPDWGLACVRPTDAAPKNKRSVATEQTIFREIMVFPPFGRRCSTRTSLLSLGSGSQGINRPVPRRALSDKWQPNDEFRAPVRLVANLHRAAMLHHDLLHDGQ